MYAGGARAWLLPLSLWMGTSWVFVPYASATFPSPSAREWERVLAGEYVAHEQHQELAGVKLFGGSAWQRIDAPADAVWQVVVQLELYRHFLPYAIEARPLAAADVLLRHRVANGEVRYRLHFERDDDQRALSFRVSDAEGTVRSGFGTLHVRELDASSCVVAWTVFAAPDLGILGRLFRGLVQRTMLEVPVRIQRYLAHQVGTTRPPAVARVGP